MVAAAIGGLLLTLVLIVIVVTCRSVKPTFSPSILSQSVSQHTYPDMNKVASQIINLDNFCEAAFLCLFDTSTSILIPLYI